MRQVSKIKFEYYTMTIALTIVNFLFGLGYVAFMSQAGLTEHDISKVLTLWSTVLLLTGIPCGLLSDRFNLKMMLVLGNVLAGIGLILFGYANQISAFLIAIIGIALSNSLIGKLPVSWLVTALKKINHDGQESQIIPIGESIAKVMTFLLGVVVSMMFSDKINNIIYFVAGGISIALSIFIFIFVTDIDHKVTSEKITFISIVKNLLSNFKNKRLVLFHIKYLFFGIACQIFVYIWQLYAINDLQIKGAYLGMIYSSFLLVLAVGYYLIAHLNKVISIFNCILVGTGCVLISFIIMFLFKNSIVFLIACLVFELGLGIEQGAILVWIQSQIKDNSRSSSLSILSTSIGISGIVATRIMPWFSYSDLWLICASLVSMAILFLLILKYQLRKHI